MKSRKSIFVPAKWGSSASMTVQHNYWRQGRIQSSSRGRCTHLRKYMWTKEMQSENLVLYWRHQQLGDSSPSRQSTIQTLNKLISQIK